MARFQVIVVLLCSGAVSCGGELVCVQSLMRHGARAPNPSVTKVCPTVFQTTRQITETFGSPPGHLTVAGLAMCVEAGAMLRRVYINEKHFMPSTYGVNALQWKFESKSSYRHLMSANAVAQGIFPQEVAVAVFSKPTSDDDVLNSPPAMCAPMTRHHIMDWLETAGREAQHASAALVTKIGRVCGSPTLLTDEPIFSQLSGNPHPALQDISDLFTFMSQQHLPLPSTLTPPERDELSRIVFDALQARTFGPEARRIMIAFAGGYPPQLAATFARAIATETSGAEPLKFSVSVSSRELHYALAAYYGLVLSVDGFPAGAIPTSSLLVWELHRDKAKKGKEARAAGEGYWVECLFWVTGEAAPRPLVMHECARGGAHGRCTFAEFKAVQTKWERTIPPFEELCAKYAAAHSASGAQLPTTAALEQRKLAIERAKANNLATVGGTTPADQATKLAMAAAVVFCAFVLGVVAGRYGWCPARGCCSGAGGGLFGADAEVADETVGLTAQEEGVRDADEGEKEWTQGESFSDAAAAAAERGGYDSVGGGAALDVQTATF